MSFEPGDFVRVQLGTHVEPAEVVDVNDMTIRVRLKNGAVIKRHVEKHVLGKITERGKK